MSSNDVDIKVKAELSRLIIEGSKISGLTNEHYNFGTISNNYAPFNKDFINFHLSAENLLVNRFGTESLYYHRFMEVSKVHVLKILMIIINILSPLFIYKLEFFNKC